MTSTSIVGEVLLAEGVRPPQRATVDVERPLDVVRAGRHRVLGLADDDAVGGRAHADRAGASTVEAGVEPQVGAGVVGVAAQHAEPVDA